MSITIENESGAVFFMVHTYWPILTIKTVAFDIKKALKNWTP